MHIKFTKHGKGCPRKAVGYLLADKDAKGDLRPKIETLRGDAQTFVAITESLDFDYRYSSAVIAWSKDDNPTDAQIQETLDQFEKHAFANLDPTRYHMNAVLHVAQDGSKHVHILVPRVDLATGKSLNIAPPGHEKYFDKVRDYLNEKYTWSKPDDLAILNADVQLPHHTHSQRAAAVEVNFSGKTKPEKKELLNKIVAQRINAGVIQNRNDVVQTLSEYGIITRNVKDTVSVKLHGDNTAIKMAGEFYKDGFNVTTYAESRARAEANQSASRTNEVDAKRVEQLYNKLQRATESRARYFADKYRFVSEIHKQCPDDNIATVQELSARRSRHNTDHITTDAAESRFNRSRELEFSKVNEPVITAEPVTTANDSAPEQSITATDRAVDFNDRKSTRATERAEQVHQIHADSRNFAVNPFIFSNFGEVSERIKNIDEPTSLLIEESSRRTEQVTTTIREVHEKINRTKRAFDPSEPSPIRVNFDTEKSDSEHRIEKAIRGFFTEIRNQHESAFTSAITESTRFIKPTASSQSSYFEQSQSFTETITAGSSSDFGANFEAFFTAYNAKQRAERKRVKQQDEELRNLSGNIDQVGRRLSQLNKFIESPSFVLKPVDSVEKANVFHQANYSHAMIADVVEWSRRQDEALKRRDREKVMYYMDCKYNSISNFLSYSVRRSKAEYEAIQDIAKNDERTIKYAENRLKMYFSPYEKDKAYRDISNAKERVEGNLLSFDRPVREAVVEKVHEIKKDYDNDSPKPF